MLIPNHPHDERLAALASADADATGDDTLAAHVAACVRCAETVAELGALRASLADMPDLRPSRPLRLLPDATSDGGSAPDGDRLAGWVRRVFAPLATAGATLALVGLIGTTMGPATESIFRNVGETLAAGGGDAGPPEEEAAGEVPAETDASRAGGEVAPMATNDQVDALAGGEDGSLDSDSYSLESAAAERDEANDSEALPSLPAERSPWPMVLFGGVALVVAALLLRWIVVPRAG